jgi:riboflavin kinase/FMN adenylyltransferase
MWIARGLPSYPEVAAARGVGPAVVALGTFDGVHLGHRAILGTAVERGRTLGLPALACTFDPHPMEVLQPGRAPGVLSSLEDRLASIAGTGIAGTVVIAFTAETAAIEPETFVSEVLTSRLHAREVVVGFNHTFGRGARGNTELLAKLGQRLGYRTHVVPPVTVDGIPVSSTAIRAALATGEVERAATFLGRPYAVVGDVVTGAARGRTLGFPTANVQADQPVLLTPGVYACRAEVSGATFGAVVNVGVRPTFGESLLAVEAHLFDFTGDVYGHRMRLSFVSRVRDERRFPSVEALKEQIAADSAEARRRLG